MFLAISKHFGDIQEDQFDFHSYCVRKMTLRAYIRMLRMEDALYSHRFFSEVIDCARRQAYLQTLAWLLTANMAIVVGN